MQTMTLKELEKFETLDEAILSAKDYGALTQEQFDLYVELRLETVKQSEREN
jgi:hypothetical protein